MTKRTSYGVLIQNEHDQILLAHVTGQPQWDIPKGAGAPGEPPLQAALRETFEETGVQLAPEDVRELGHVDYRRNKALHLFHARVSTRQVDVSKCVCSSHFTDRRTGDERPEMDGFRWAHLGEVEHLCIPPMAAVILRCVEPPRAKAA